ncbi:MAG: S53 family peptidase [Acetobacteraceae bacterium]|jgi:subtilase family serine protease
MTIIQPEYRVIPHNVSITNEARARSRDRPYIKFPKSAPAERASDARPWDVAALCWAYGWPVGLVGGGVIAIVELGGGWVSADLEKFCSNNNIPMPSVTDVSVDGTGNRPGVDTDSDGEVALDIQVAAAAYSVATGKPAIIRIYWVNDIATGVRAAIHDDCDVCSISWGSDEAQWGKPAAEYMEQTAAAAVAAGMVVFAASGDNDSSDGGPNAANVDTPASCPHVIACGGTRKTATLETVWNNDPGQASGEGTGGGYSTLFQPMPVWQIGAPNMPGRMVPDVAANADPETGYNVVIGGQVSPTGGTSAVAPLYAGLFAAFGTKLGWVAPALWRNPLCFNDITVGDNGAFRAQQGPDACTGLGSPIADRLAGLLVRPVAAGS